MPIYEYHCSHCGFQKDHLQKLRDKPLTTCPACGQETYAKAVTAAGFQLKGTGWYATDFKGSNSAATQCRRLLRELRLPRRITAPAHTLLSRFPFPLSGRFHA